MEDRYYIAIDENGEAYIEHGLFDRARSTGQRAHKYLMKIGEGAKARYLYTQEEVRAYMQGGQKRNPNIKRPEDFEIRARRPDSAPNKMQQTKSSGIKRPEDFEIRARRPENVSSKTAEKTGQSVKDTVKKVVETVKDKAGVDERQRAEEAWSKVPKQLSSKDEKGMQAFKEANKAQDEYRKTPLGKAEYLTERAQEIVTGVDGSAKDIAKKVGSTVKSKAERMKEEFRKKKDEVAENIPGVRERKHLEEEKKALREAERASEIADKRKGYAESKSTETDSSGNKWYKNEEDAKRAADADLESVRKKNEMKENQRRVNVSQGMYDDTLLGKAEKALNNLSEKGREKERQKEELSSQVRKNQNDSEREKYEDIVRGGKINKNQFVDNEYIYTRGSNTGHNAEVRSLMKAESEYNQLQSQYNSLKKNGKGSNSQLEFIEQKMNKAKKAYESAQDNLIDVINADIEDAERKLKQMNE